jgi:hypothetical protein
VDLACGGSCHRLLPLPASGARGEGWGDFAGFAVPDQFHLAFVGEEDEAVFLRERLALIDELDEVALLGVGEFVGV